MVKLAIESFRNSDSVGRSRKTLIYLILTLNHTYPDYDFSQIRAQHFEKEVSVPTVEEAVDSQLLEVSKVSFQRLNTLLTS